MSDVATKEYVDKIMAMSDASTIVEDEPCDVSDETPRSLMHTTVLRLEQLLKDALREVDEYRRAIVDLEGKIQRLEDWKESALAVEREWNPNALATMLGGRPGESQREVIQREVPKLLARINRLEAAVKAYQHVYTPDGHVAPHDCFATGPRLGDPIQDLIVCPGCWAEKKAKEARP